MPAQFDGGNRIITLASGVTNVNVGTDLYSEWKNWALQGANLGYAPAFRTIGGDPLSAGINAGAYFFLQNQPATTAAGGWRIRPPEENITILVAGNLVPEDSTQAIIIPTTGTYTALVAGLQPITQQVDEVLTTLQNVSYGGVVHIDTENGVNGTGFPLGTLGSPVKTIEDAKIIADAVGANTYHISHRLVLNEPYPYWNFKGSISKIADLIDPNGQDVEGSRFDNITITGVLNGVVDLNDCVLNTVSGLNGTSRNCTLIGNIVLDGTLSLGSSVSLFNSTGAGAAGAILDLAGRPGVGVGFADADGKWTIKNCYGTAPISATIRFAADTGSLVLDTSCTAGLCYVEGDLVLTNNAGPGFITIDHRLAKNIWDEPIPQTTVSGSFGEYVSTKLLSVAKFLGLK